MDNFQELDSRGWEEQEASDPERSVGHSRQLYWIWNEKSHMLKIAAELNLFQSSYFTWLDIGAIRWSLLYDLSCVLVNIF